MNLSQTVKTIVLIMLVSVNDGYSQQESYNLHFGSIVADAHNDVIGTHTMKGRDIAKYIEEGQTDLVRLKEGGIKLQVFAIFCNQTYGKGRAFSYANSMIDAMELLIKDNQETIALASNLDDIYTIIRQKKIAAMFGIEGGHIIENRMDYLHALAERGMKYLTITWNNSTEWATSAYDEVKHPSSGFHKGLTEQGRRYIEELNKFGVMADLSHAGEQTFYDVLEVSTKPVLASHSNCYAIMPHSRNLKDKQIEAMAANGGVIGINFYSGFIDQGYEQRRNALLNRYGHLVGELSSKYPMDSIHLTRELFRRLPVEEVNSIRPPLSRLIDHLDHIVKIAGIDHVCLGSDFDGAESFSGGMDDVSCYPLITAEMIKRGYTDYDIKKVLGQNLLRVLKENEV